MILTPGSPKAPGVTPRIGFCTLALAMLAATSATGGGAAHAQDPEPRIERPIDLSQKPLVRPGSRVRITAADLFDGRAQGKVESIRPDTLVLNTRRLGELTAPLTAVDDLSLHRGNNQDLFRIAAIFPGAFAGAVAADAAVPSQRDDFAHAVVVSVGGAIGLFLGAVAGYYIDRWVFGERWEEIPVSRIRWESRNLNRNSASGTAGLAIGFSHSF